MFTQYKLSEKENPLQSAGFQKWYANTESTGVKTVGNAMTRHCTVKNKSILRKAVLAVTDRNYNLRFPLRSPIFLFPIIYIMSTNGF